MSVTVGDLVVKAAVSVQLIDISGVDDASFNVAADEIATWLADVTGFSVEKAVFEIQGVNMLLNLTGLFDTPEFDVVHQLCRITQNVEIIDAAQDIFVDYVKSELIRRKQELQQEVDTAEEQG
jgi:hypothetical protein